MKLWVDYSGLYFNNNCITITVCIFNQSRICGKGVGLDLFPSDSLEPQPYDFDAIAHIGPIWCRMTVENFVRIACRVFEKIEKGLKMVVFGHFWVMQNVMKIGPSGAHDYFCFYTPSEAKKR